MEKLITFNNGEEVKEIAVTNIFAFTYNALKTVLKIQIEGAKASFEDIQSLAQNDGAITYLVDGEIKAVYTGYEYGDAGLTINFDALNDMFNVEIVQKGSLEERISACEDAIEALMGMISLGIVEGV